MNSDREPGSIRDALILPEDVAELPDHVFLLVTTSGNDQYSEVEVRLTTRNERAIAAYSSVDRLTNACGGGQPWVHLARERLAPICKELKIDIIVFDAVLDLEPRYPEIDSRTQPPLKPLETATGIGGLLYVPSRPVATGQRMIKLELQPDPTGRPLLLIYTSPDLLEAGCGPYQPWIAIHPDDLPGVIEQSGATGFLLNPVLAERSRHTGPVQDWTVRRAGTT